MYIKILRVYYFEKEKRVDNLIYLYSAYLKPSASDAQGGHVITTKRICLFWVDQNYSGYPWFVAEHTNVGEF